MGDLTLEQLGLTEQEHSALPAEHARALAATLDVPFDASGPLPVPWHWAFFNPVTGTSGLGPDGHPRRDSALLVDFPRRMWVGGEVQVSKPLRTDRPAVRRTTLRDHARKHGSSGDLLLVTLEHSIEQDGTTHVTERQDVIYRPAGGVTPPPGAAVDLATPGGVTPPPRPAVDPATPSSVTPPPGPAVDLATPGGWREIVEPSTALLFRFSAVTFNSHRIHYDAAYATGVEHYPGLVVHGPLTAMLLAESAARHLGRPLRLFSYRASSPLFVDQPIAVDGVLDPATGDGTATMTAIRIDGVVGMTATAS